MTQKLTLYGCWRSTCTHRATLALSLRGVGFAYRPIDLSAREQEGEAFLSVSRDAQVPVLVVGGDRLTQSMAIVSYVDAVGDPATPPLFPAEPLARARSMAIAERVATYIQPLTLPGGIRRGIARAFEGCVSGDEREQCLDGFIRSTLHENLRNLDACLQDGAGTCALGDSVTVADVFIYPQLLGALRLGLELVDYPCLKRIHAGLTGNAAVAAVDPARMPDAPPGTRPQTP